MISYTLAKHSDKKKLGEATLSEKEMQLLRGGLYYAMVRDSIPKRRAAYKELAKKMEMRETPAAVWKQKKAVI